MSLHGDDARNLGWLLRCPTLLLKHVPFLLSTTAPGLWHSENRVSKFVRFLNYPGSVIAFNSPRYAHYSYNLQHTMKHRFLGSSYWDLDLLLPCLEI